MSPPAQSQSDPINSIFREYSKLPKSRSPEGAILSSIESDPWLAYGLRNKSLGAVLAKRVDFNIYSDPLKSAPGIGSTGDSVL